MPKKSRGNPKQFNLACLRCDLWWYARKKSDQVGYERAREKDLSHLGEWAGYHRYMYARRAQEVREMSLNDYINSELKTVLSAKAVIEAAGGDTDKLLPIYFERELDV